jgi:hypothetical protein
MGSRCSLARTVSCDSLIGMEHRAYHFPDVNQFSIITELLGTPPDDVIQTIASENASGPEQITNDVTDCSLQTLRFVQSLPKRERVPFNQKLRCNDTDGKFASRSDVLASYNDFPA